MLDAQTKVVNPYLFVVGCSRSGTTLLKRMIDAHPEVAIPLESHWITKYYRQGRGLSSRGYVRPRIIRSLQKQKKFGSLSLADDELEAILGNDRKLAFPDFVSQVYDLYGARQGKRLVGDKTPPYTREILLLHRLFPKSRFVHIFRDGRNVALSVLSWKRARVTVGRIGTFREDPVTTVALWWEWYVRLGREAGRLLGPETYTEVCYEHLLDAQEAECRRLCAFLGLEFDPGMLSYHEGRISDDPGLDAKAAWLPPTKGLRDWTTAMSDEDVLKFEAAAGELLTELGYPRRYPSPPEHVLRHAADLRARFDGRPLPTVWGG